jgi:hypothetical protein
VDSSRRLRGRQEWQFFAALPRAAEHALFEIQAAAYR